MLGSLISLLTLLAAALTNDFGSVGFGKENLIVAFGTDGLKILAWFSIRAGPNRASLTRLMAI